LRTSRVRAQANGRTWRARADARHLAEAAGSLSRIFRASRCRSARRCGRELGTDALDDGRRRCGSAGFRRSRRARLGLVGAGRENARRRRVGLVSCPWQSAAPPHAGTAQRLPTTVTIVAPALELEPATVKSGPRRPRRRCDSIVPSPVCPSVGRLAARFEQIKSCLAPGSTPASGLQQRARPDSGASVVGKLEVLMQSRPRARRALRGDPTPRTGRLLTALQAVAFAFSARSGSEGCAVAVRILRLDAHGDARPRDYHEDGATKTRSADGTARPMAELAAGGARFLPFEEGHPRP